MWIELHDTLLDHIKLKRLSRELDITRVIARGYIVTLWLNTLRHATDGCLTDWSDEDLAEYSEWTGDPVRWREALLDCAWLVLDENGLVHVNDWREYASHLKAAKSRAQARNRKRRQRDRERENLKESKRLNNGHDMSRNGHGDITHQSQQVTKEPTRPDQNRPDQTGPDPTVTVTKKLPPLPDAGLPPLPVSVAVSDFILPVQVEPIRQPGERFQCHGCDNTLTMLDVDLLNNVTGHGFCRDCADNGFKSEILGDETFKQSSQTFTRKWPIASIEAVTAFVAEQGWQIQLTPKNNIMATQLLDTASISKVEADYAASQVNAKTQARQRNAGLFLSIIDQERLKIASMPKAGTEHAKHEARRRQTPKEREAQPTDEQWAEGASKAKALVESLAEGMNPK
jgi:hypothetical protein